MNRAVGPYVLTDSGLQRLSGDVCNDAPTNLPAALYEAKHRSFLRSAAPLVRPGSGARLATNIGLINLNNASQHFLVAGILAHSETNTMEQKQGALVADLALTLDFTGGNSPFGR